MRKSKLFVLAALCGAAACPASASAPDNADRPQGHQHAHAMPASGNFGELSFPNSGNQAAQAPFLRGVKLLHNFQYDETTAAFKQADKVDPAFAPAY